MALSGLQAVVQESYASITTTRRWDQGFWILWARPFLTVTLKVTNNHTALMLQELRHKNRQESENHRPFRRQSQCLERRPRLSCRTDPLLLQDISRPFICSWQVIRECLPHSKSSTWGSLLKAICLPNSLNQTLTWSTRLLGIRGTFIVKKSMD